MRYDLFYNDLRGETQSYLKVSKKIEANKINFTVFFCKAKKLKIFSITPLKDYGKKPLSNGENIIIHDNLASYLRYLQVLIEIFILDIVSKIIKNLKISPEFKLWQYFDILIIIILKRCNRKDLKFFCLIERDLCKLVKKNVSVT